MTRVSIFRVLFCKGSAKVQRTVTKKQVAPKNSQLGGKNCALENRPTFRYLWRSQKQVIFNLLDRTTTGMKEQIQQLIAVGQTKDALNLLVQMNPDALLLQAQYNNGEKQFNLGLIDFGEWGRIQARVNFAALEMAVQPAPTSGASVPANPGTRPPATTSGEQPQPVKASVFISYSHRDKGVVDKIVKHLKDNGVDVVIDREVMKAGQSIQHFIEQSIKKSHFVLSVVSSNSLTSGWVSKESLAASYAEWLDEKYFLPARLDDEFFKPAFQVTAVRAINEQLEGLKNTIKELEEIGGDARDLQSDVAQLIDLKNNLPKVIRKLKDVYTVDLKEESFEDGLAQIMNALKGG